MVVNIDIVTSRQNRADLLRTPSRGTGYPRSAQPYHHEVSDMYTSRVLNVNLWGEYNTFQSFRGGIQSTASTLEGFPAPVRNYTGKATYSSSARLNEISGQTDYTLFR